mgnify:CR=1 FL=1
MINNRDLYQILQFKATNSQYLKEPILFRVEGGFTNSNMTVVPEDVMIKWPGMFIHQVVRIPDGTMFTIGDSFSTKFDGPNQISYFYIDEYTKEMKVAFYSIDKQSYPLGFINQLSIRS